MKHRVLVVLLVLLGSGCSISKPRALCPRAIVWQGSVWERLSSALPKFLGTLGAYYAVIALLSISRYIQAKGSWV
jgi:hypothetical protein